MNCPVCKEPMAILEHDDVEVDYCFACHGIWLDAGELELLFGDREMAGGFMTAGKPHPAAGEKIRRCPICRKKMAKTATGGEQPVTYDLCPRGDGLWFDKGELAAILEHGSAAAGGEDVAAWLRDMFQQE